MKTLILEYIQKSLRDQTLEVHYQPQLCKHANQSHYTLTGAEALIRPDVSICDAEFLVNVAESEGMAHALGCYVMRKALGEFREWRKEMLVNESFNLSINITGAQINDPKFFDDTLRIVRESQIKPYQITLEISEMSLIDDMNIAKIYQLSVEGFDISLDDFGKGYSSLSRLKFLPISEIKIDKSFISDITKTSQDVAIITAMFQLTQALNKFCVVEGVESKEQFAILEEIGFECFQGYYFSRSLTSEKFMDTIKQEGFSHSP